MSKKKRKPVAPKFVLWTEESQRRFQASVDTFELRTAGLQSEVAALGERVQQLGSIQLMFLRQVEKLGIEVERLEKRSNAASRANATRKAQAQAQAQDQAQAPGGFDAFAQMGRNLAAAERELAAAEGELAAAEALGNEKVVLIGEALPIPHDVQNGG